MQVAAKDLRTILRVDPETGFLFWLPRDASHFAAARSPAMAAYKWNRQHAGRQCFLSLNPNGYAKGSIFDRTYSAHRVVWALTFGEWPTQDVDHINGIRNDNRPANLREVDRSRNCKNRKLSVRNRSSVSGVRFDAKARKWTASITSKMKPVYLGSFDTMQEAASARQSAEVAFGFDPVRPVNAPRTIAPAARKGGAE